MNILVVDDSAWNRRLLRAQLKDQNRAVLEASDGVEALEVLEREPVDAVISDLLMPRMDGYRLCHEVRHRERLCATPFILLTGTYDSPSDRELAEEVGADVYLTKPAATDVLLAALTEAQEKAAGRSHAPVLTEANHVGLLKQYNVALIEKLEERNLELGRVNAQLQASKGRLVEAEALYHSLVETLPENIFRKDRAGRLTFANGHFYETLGLSMIELLGKTDADLFPPELAAKYRADDLRVMETGEPLSMEEENVGPNGQPIYVKVTKVPVRDAAGNIIGIQGLFTEITAQREHQEQLRQSQKMEGIGQLAGGVAHDFNNILSAIIMQAELTAMTEGLTEEVQEGLREIRSGAQRAAHLTRQLLLFSRKQVMQMRELDLNTAVDSLLTMLRRIIGEDVRLEFYPHPGPLPTRADAGMLDQILMNLAVNARDAMRGGGRLRIETGEHTVPAGTPRPNPDAQPGPYVWVKVSDTGTGIPPTVLPRIFEPFFTTKEVGKGTGLGLATVFGIVKQHQGWLTVTSDLGKGTTFQVFLPVLAADAPTDIPMVTPVQARGGSETILLVEDEVPVRRVTRLMLERMGYRVLEAGSGAEALTLWQALRDPVALLLTDLVMPEGVSGQQLAARLQAQQPGLKVVFMSGYSAEIAGRDLDLRPGQNFVQKPFAPHQLLTTVRCALESEALATLASVGSAPADA